MPDDMTIDCSTGDVTCTPLTADEIAAQQAAQAQLAQQQQAAAAAQQQQVATVAASTDSALIALAQLVGVLEPAPAPTASTASKGAQ